MQQILKTEEASAGRKNRPQALSAAIPTEASDTERRKGDMMRVIWAVSSNFAGLSRKPAASIQTSPWDPK